MPVVARVLVYHHQRRPLAPVFLAPVHAHFFFGDGPGTVDIMMWSYAADLFLVVMVRRRLRVLGCILTSMLRALLFYCAAHKQTHTQRNKPT